MKTRFILPLLAALAIIPCVAQSTNNTPTRPDDQRQNRIDRREANLERRIDQGVTTGKLSADQASNLEGKLDQIKQDESKALQNDGRIGPREARQLNAEANDLSHEIHREKHPGKHK